jgi:hypothetical protein
MASALAFPQQQQQPQGLPIQSVSSNSVDGALLSALAAYITGGSDARHTTEQEIQDLASEAIARPGGRAHLEAIIQSEGYIEHKVWKNQATAKGKLTLTKTDITVRLEVATLQLVFTAEGSGVFPPATATLPV